MRSDFADWSDPLLRRFVLKTDEDPETGCWNWLGHVKSNGYGYFRHPETTLAHRASWMMMRGPIPDGLTIDHLCRNKRCVNPSHLEPVTALLNVKRAADPWAACRRLHPDDDSRWSRRGDGRMHCMECNRLRALAKRRVAGTV